MVPTLAAVVVEAEIGMSLPASSRARFAADLTICRILTGICISGAHGAVDPVRAVDAMSAYHEAGFTTWDLANHYGPAEEFIGDFRRQIAHVMEWTGFQRFRRSRSGCHALVG